MSFSGHVLVYGGKGALGACVVSHFKRRDFWVGSVDLFANDAADANFIVDTSLSWTEQEKQVLHQVSSTTQPLHLDAVLCVAGGWAGGAASSEDFVKNSDLMWKQSVWSSVIAARLASKHLKPGGLLTLPGARPCVEGTPGMMGYGMAKAAVHQMTKSFADPVAAGLPEGAAALALLPVTLDTPMNRKFMADADKSTWTPLDFVAETLFEWTQSRGRPSSGSLVEVVTLGGESRVEVVG